MYTFIIFTAFIRSQFQSGIFCLTPPISINEKSRTNRQTRAKLARRETINRREYRRTEAERATRTAETIDGLERNWPEEKLLIDEKSRDNRRTEAEWATRRAETIDGLERNWPEEKLLIDEKSRNNRQTEAERATRRAETSTG